MNTNQFPKEQIELMQAIYDMRMAQNDYFKQPNQYRLKIAKLKEAKVDGYVDYFVVNKLIDTRSTTQRVMEIQTDLFKS